MDEAEKKRREEMIDLVFAEMLHTLRVHQAREHMRSTQIKTGADAANTRPTPTHPLRWGPPLGKPAQPAKPAKLSGAEQLRQRGGAPPRRAPNPPPVVLPFVRPTTDD